MRFLVIELDGAVLDRAQHRLQRLVGKRAAVTDGPRTPIPRRWLQSWDPVLPGRLWPTRTSAYAERA